MNTRVFSFLAFSIVIAIAFSGCTDVATQVLKELTKPQPQPPTDNCGDTADQTGLTTVGSNSNNFIVSAPNKKISKDVESELEDAASTLRKRTGKRMIVTSASRSLKDQATLFYNYCLSTKDKKCSTDTCDITNGTLFSKDANGAYKSKGALKGINLDDKSNKEKIICTMVKNGKPENCGHTSNVAVDVWCEGTVGKSVNVSCQEELTNIMIEKGFCRLNSEAWHFEWNAKRVSSGCRQDMGLKYTRGGKTYDPKVDLATGKECEIWNYTSNSCDLVKQEEEEDDEQQGGTQTWAGTWSGSLTFTNNCVRTASCRYIGSPGAIVLKLRQTTGNNVEGTLYLNTRKFKSEELSNSNGGGCPTLASVVPGESPISGTIESSGLRLIDVGDDVWTLRLTSNGHLQGDISSDDPTCMGIHSDNVVLDKIE